MTKRADGGRDKPPNCLLLNSQRRQSVGDEVEKMSELSADEIFDTEEFETEDGTEERDVLDLEGMEHGDEVALDLIGNSNVKGAEYNPYLFATFRDPDTGEEYEVLVPGGLRSSGWVAADEDNLRRFFNNDDWYVFDDGTRQRGRRLIDTVLDANLAIELDEDGNEVGPVEGVHGEQRLYAFEEETADGSNTFMTYWFGVPSGGGSGARGVRKQAAEA